MRIVRRSLAERVWVVSLALIGLGVVSARQAKAHEPPPLAGRIRLRATLNERQVVRPPELQPPTLGTGSSSVGTADLQIDTTTGAFSFSLEVEGIDPTSFDNAHGPNQTAIHIRRGSPEVRGPIVLDVHELAREARPESDGVISSERGFLLTLSGDIQSEQGELDVGLTPSEISDVLRSTQAYIAVQTTDSTLFQSGEIRGNLRFVPEKLRLASSLDGIQVVRPDELRPPTLGSGSLATGEAMLLVNTTNGYFSLDLEVDGMDPSALDNTHGLNGTAIQVRRGDREARGPIILDVHHFARQANPATNGVTQAEEGFRLHADGVVDGSVDELIDILRTETAYLAVHTTRSELFREAGEIRGSLTVVPDELRVRAFLDDSQVVRPAELQPPRLGTGSPGVGNAELLVNKDTGRFSLDLQVDGIAPNSLDNAHGPNQTAIHLHFGFAETAGPIILDVHHFARQYESETNGVTATEGGFSMHAEGHITRVQGGFTAAFPFPEILSFLRGRQAYIAVHTITSEVFRSGEIRGNLEAVPEESAADEIRLRARLDESQIVRPVEYQPPVLGSGSPAEGEATLVVDASNREFSFELLLEGIDPLDISESFDGFGGNETGIHVRKGNPYARGSILLDVGYYARRTPDGIVVTDGGLELRASGQLNRVQGRHDTLFTAHEILDLLRCEEAYVTVYTTTRDLFEDGGEIRGNLKTSPETSAPVNRFVRGDCNGDGNAAGEVTDAVYVLNHSFSGGPAPPCLRACDVNGDGSVLGEVTDAVYLLGFNFLGGPSPPPPFPGCGPGELPTDAALRCMNSPEICR